MKTYSVNNQQVSVEKIAEMIQSRFAMVNDGYPSQYFTVLIEEEDGDSYASEAVKIRVSDHSANRHNNGDQVTLSFVTDTCDQGYRRMVNEWEVIDTEDMLTSTYEYVSDILEYELNEVKLEEY